MKNLLKNLLTGPQLEEFERLLNQVRNKPTKALDWSSIHSPNDSMQVDYESLADPGVKPENFSRLVIGKLNGGLGTSMGCAGPKSLIKVKDEKSFLDLIVEQVRVLNQKWNCDIPLLLMNSFYTDKEIGEFVSKTDLPITTFKQNMFPRLHSESFLPLNPEEWGEQAWYPPGHGDFYHCIEQQGILSNLINDEKDILFISNADNLGAVADAKILNYMIDKEIPFLIEVTPKTPADVKGGTLYEQNGKLKLLEIAQVPEKHIDEFCSQEKFSVFNTNNIWINLVALEEKLKDGPLSLNVIQNQKKIQGKPVVQLETAIGSALDCFEGAVGLCVSRDRFMPVKKTEDLLLVQSNLFNLEDGRLLRNPLRKASHLPEIIFGQPLDQVEAFLNCFKVIPDLLDLEELEIAGQVSFEGAASLKGKVKINGTNGLIQIESGRNLEDETIDN
ncbi:MAG: UTP--glucose-1-phosphate uridylyltransferase [Nitrospinota bacterium]